jgi:predicted CXXCH cytochrome family protein
VSTVLIRQSAVRADGTAERLETELEAGTLSIGSGADCLLQLPGIAPLHGRLEVGRGVAHYKAHASNAAQANGRSCKRAKLKPGDKLEIGPHKIIVIVAPTGFDLGLDVEIGRADTVQWQSSFRTTLEQAGFKRRAWVWRLSLAAVLLSLVLPFFFSLLVPGDSIKAPWFITHTIWNSGPLASGHRFGNEGECQRCHTNLFRRVNDDVCRECHMQINDHTDAKVLAAIDMETGRCARCHREHDEPSTLLVTRDSQCVDCHGREKGIARTGDPVRMVRGFTEKTHPQFEVTFPVLGLNEAAANPWVYKTVSIDSAKDASNLKFPHDVHMNRDKVSHLRTGETLNCASCHEPATDGQHFRPIKMERHCSKCHELGFDDDDPFRQLPHGDAREAILVMEGHFLKQALSPPPPRTDGFKWRRIPDRAPRGSSGCARGDIECAKRLFAAEVADQFMRGGCVTCHVVKVRKDMVHLPDRFVVTPVKLADDLMPQARFNHTLHRVMDDKTAVDACLACHPAKKSHEPTDVLMPKIATCLKCHADESTTSRAPMRCDDCHEYHPPHMPLETKATP